MVDVATLVDQLTLEEKALLLEGVNAWGTNAIDRLSIPSIVLTDGPHGVRKVRDAAGGFGIGENESSTAFPTSATVASSWNPERAYEMARAIGAEARSLGVDVLLAPGINIKRSPLCGRNFEYFSEDPLVSGVFGSAFVRGLQSAGVGASVKHFAANSNEDYRFVGDSVLDERALREIYLRAFERVVTHARPETVMCAYNRVNGTFASESRQLLTEILRDEWGFDGLVVTDWGATRDRVAGLAAGTDLDMPGEVVHNRESIIAAVRTGALAKEIVDRAVTRVLALVERHSGAREAPSFDPTYSARLAEEIATESAVLLKNDGVLPLDRRGMRIAVVGEFFEHMRFQGAGSSLITPPQVVSPRAAFDRRGIDYVYAAGYEGRDAATSVTLLQAAVDAARGADVVLFFGGLTDLEESEGFDREHLALGVDQVRVLRALIDAGTPVVLVLFGGAPVEVPDRDRLAGILDMYLPGQQGGEATAALLFGEANPSGRLAESWPRSAAESSAHDDYNSGVVARYYESVYVGYRFYDAAGTELAFPFGFGLSYTDFEYSGLTVAVTEGTVRARVTVANTGDRDGAEVVQLYVRSNGGAVFKPVKELRAFAKVAVPAGGATEVELSFALDDLAYWDVATHGWRLENGDYEILIAASSQDVRLAAPLVVTTGVDSRSPYSPSVDAAYASPPTRIVPEFAELLGGPVPVETPSRRLTLETRLGDASRSLVGRAVVAGIIGAVRRDYRRALRLPPSLERDAKIKNSYFVVRMMPNASLRSLVMSSSGGLPYEVAAGLADIAAGHLFRGVRRILGRPRGRGAA